MKEAFSGGFTHANARKVGKVLTKMRGYDFVSSYPYNIIVQKFPMQRGEYKEKATIQQIHEYSEHYCCMFRIKFSSLNSTTAIEHPLSSSKCRANAEDKRKWVLDNGRIVCGDNIETTITEQDLFTIEEFYEWPEDGVEIFDLYLYEKEYLPSAFVKAVVELYKKKTQLKDVEGEELNYLLLKEMLNSAYGMMVTDIVREQLEYDEENGYTSNFENMTEEDYGEFVKTQIERYNDNPYRFLFYAWGIWVTAYARRNLFTGIKAVGYDYVYSDTDSIKILHPDSHQDYIDSYNRGVEEKLRLAAEYHKIPFEDLAPKNKFGVTKMLGIWEDEGMYDEFKTLGAKRYLWRKGDKYQLTVAGVNKAKGVEYLKTLAKRTGKSPFDFFNLGLVFPEEYSGRLILTYIDEEQHHFLTDYMGNTMEISELSAIHMEPSDYSMNTVDNFINYLFTIWEERW